jgi:hypothetical protein
MRSTEARYSEVGRGNQAGGEVLCSYPAVGCFPSCRMATSPAADGVDKTPLFLSVAAYKTVSAHHDLISPTMRRGNAGVAKASALRQRILVATARKNSVETGDFPCNAEPSRKALIGLTQSTSACVYSAPAPARLGENLVARPLATLAPDSASSVAFFCRHEISWLVSHESVSRVHLDDLKVGRARGRILLCVR